VYRLRSRIVNFRVTDEEFERLKNASALQGSRCLSDFARSVMLTTAGAPVSPAGPAAPVNNRLHSVEQRLAALESSVARLEDAALPRQLPVKCEA
jgi:hypothetical protein